MSLWGERVRWFMGGMFITLGLVLLYRACQIIQTEHTTLESHPASR